MSKWEKQVTEGPTVNQRNGLQGCISLTKSQGAYGT